MNYKNSNQCSFFSNVKVLKIMTQTYTSYIHFHGDVKKNTFRHFNTIHFFVSNFFMFFCYIMKIKFIYLPVTNYVTFKKRKKNMIFFINWPFD
jgi:hypothetical protein